MQTITIQSWKEIKRGVSNQGKEWVLYEVLDSEGKKYSTFGSVLNAANVKAGESYLVSTETRKNGKYTNVSIKEIYRANNEEKPAKTQDSANNSTFEAEVLKKLDEILKRIP